MNTALKILLIVLIGVLVAAAFYLMVENTSLFSSLEGSMQEGKGQRPEGDTSGRGERNGGEGDNHNEGASLSQGLAEVGGSLAKISGITLVVLAIQFIFARFPKRKTARKLAA